MSLSRTDAQNLHGVTMLDSSGTKIGKVADAYIDAESQTPEWAGGASGYSAAGRASSRLPKHV